MADRTRMILAPGAIAFLAVLLASLEIAETFFIVIRATQCQTSQPHGVLYDSISLLGFLMEIVR